MGEELDRKLEKYAGTDYYPFHMPGHKRRELFFPNPYKVDITEVDGFDNLHHPQGILLEEQRRASDLYGSKNTWLLVNGSTCGLLAAICATAGRGKKILMARNVHKAAYHAAYLNCLITEYLYPEIGNFQIPGAISVNEVERGLEQHPDAAAVVITSPTYEGVVSDIEKIAEIVHSRHIPLIVDEAHGAHFGFHPYFPESAIKNGADLVVQSMHKTLPSFTQTALLHFNSSCIKKEKVEKYLGIFESSSPSYLFLAGMEKCFRLLNENGKFLFENLRLRLIKFREAVSELEYLHLIGSCDLKREEAFCLDPSKLVIVTEGSDLDGQRLYQILLEKYHLQLEMSSGNYTLAMTSIMDTEDGFLRLARALKEIDSSCVLKGGSRRKDRISGKLYGRRQKNLEIWETEEKATERIKLSDACGRISTDYVYLYPPGIPIIVPGEKIDEEFVTIVKECIHLGLRLEGIADIRNERINVVNC